MPPPREGYLGAFGRIVSSFAGGPPEGARNVLQGMGPWLQQLSLSATAKWLPHLLLGIPCEVLVHGAECPAASIQACVACHKPCCADHAFVASDGSAVCYACVTHAAQAAKPADPKIPGEKPPGTGPGPGNRRPPPGTPPPGPQGQPRPPNRPPPEAYIHARKVLGVRRGASAEVVDRKYRELLKRWHPDRFVEPGVKADAEARFKEIRVAYDFLKAHPE